MFCSIRIGTDKTTLTTGTYDLIFITVGLNIIWRNESFKNRENLQEKKAADSVLLSLFMKINGKCNDSHCFFWCYIALILFLQFTDKAILNIAFFILEIKTQIAGRLVSVISDTSTGSVDLFLALADKFSTVGH